MRRLLCASLIVLPVIALAQAPSAQPPDRPSVESGAAPSLPVRRVILYKTGVGYFEHLGNIRNRQDITIRFTSAQLNDALNSLTVLDLGKGQITGISYNSVAPLQQRLGALRLPLDESTTQAHLLSSLRGARVAVTTGSGAVSGRLLSVEQRVRQRENDTITTDTISVVTDAGDIRTFDLSPSVHVRIVERDLRQEVGRYLDLVGTTRAQDVRGMVISASGTGERPLFVSYISEVPIWKSTYRLMLSTKRKPLLQGWAVVDNTIGEDWQNVELSLVAGAPQSFIQHISQPHYGQRAVVPMPSTVLLAPQTHQATIGDGTGVVRGIVRDSAGSILPGVTVRLVGQSGIQASGVTRSDGRYEVTVPPGTYSMRFELPGFSPQVFENWRVASGTTSQQDVTMAVGAASETVRLGGVGAAQFRTEVGSALGAGKGLGGVAGGIAGRPPQSPPAPQAPVAMPRNVYDQASVLAPQASAASLGDLFEYRIKEPITLRKNQSALVPIMSANIEAEKVSLWNRSSGSGRPLRAVWLTNATGLTLDGGSMTLIDDDAFAGEGLLEPLKPGEKRLLSYAADLGVMVDARRQDGSGRITRLRARDGIITQETEDRVTWAYRARNENAGPTTLIVEHRVQPGFMLAGGQTPVESTADTQRFRVILPPAKETVHEVREVRRVDTRITVDAIDRTFIAMLAKGGFSTAGLEGALKPVLDKNADIARLDRDVSTLENERETIGRDQQRLRENMKALRGSSEEKQLLQRYTKQLDQQETRLETVQKELTRLYAEREKSVGELSALIANLSFDLTPG